MDPPTEAVRGALLVTGILERADIPELCDRARRLLHGCDRGAALVCDLGELAACDVVAVDALAHLKLVACRFGTDMRVVRASEELEELIALAGLSDVLRVDRA